MVNNALIQSFLTNKMFQEARDVVTRASQRWDKNKLEFETELPTATKQWRHIITAMKKSDFYISSLKLSIPEEMFEELRRIPPNVRSNLNEIRRIAAAEEGSQRAFMEHT